MKGGSWRIVHGYDKPDAGYSILDTGENHVSLEVGELKDVK